MIKFVQFTQSIDSDPVYVNVGDGSIILVRRTKPGDPGAGSQGTLIVTSAAAPDDRVVVSEPVNIVTQLMEQASPSKSSGPATPPVTRGTKGNK